MAKPKIIFSDFDGTLTERGFISPALFDVFELSHRLGSEMIVVTGRPLSWSHFLMSHTPLKASISEGGGVLTIREGKRFKDIYLAPEEDIKKLKEVTKILFEKIPDFYLSDDSTGRITDRAIELDYLELGDNEERIAEILNHHEINFSKSNVHLNFWAGDISKKKSIEYYLDNFCTSSKEECIYFGDSLNDQSVFSWMENCVGVSNISRVLPVLKYRPKTILQGSKNKEVFGVKNYLKSLLK
jgi:HAD superfamily hydrolase (TIGR01484 family)